MSPANRRTVDSSVPAAIHHPLRHRLLDLLRADGPATASRLAEATGELVGNVSHHLKVLATAGVIAEVPELAKTRRERWWRVATAVDYSWSTERWLTLTPERLDELSARIENLIREYHDDPSEGADAHDVFVFAHAVPGRR
ncbi:helix-turn-helix domain-containing protein [Kribbella koreensis]|uniref:Helix-turn-helix domain-containing protein n=2 Tax=Kribbella TaxID=182639 RepID=A0ABP6VP14_9ACTN